MFGTALGFEQMVPFLWAAKEDEQDEDYAERERQAVPSPLGKKHHR